MSVLAIVTARGGSKRIPRKNVRDFCGSPIISYPIKAALGSNIFSEVMVSTDDSEIAEVARSLGAVVPFFRSAKNSDDFSTTADVMVEVLETYKTQGKEFDFVCCLYPTAPFVTSEKLKEAYLKLSGSISIPSVVPVVRFGFPIQRALTLGGSGLEFREPEYRNTRSQDLEPMYHDSGQFYFLRVKIFLETESLFPSGSQGIMMSEMEVQDIDNETDWKLAEAKYKLLNNG